VSRAVIDVNEADIVATRRTSGGRFVLFTSTDVRPGWPIRWWGAVADTGGDGLGLLVRVDELAAPEGWTARQLLMVALERTAAECERRPSATGCAAFAHLDLALSLCRGRGGREARDDPVSFERGGEASPYAWTVARCGGHALALCPDPMGKGEGVTPEQVLIILDQLLGDAVRSTVADRQLWACRRHVASALAAEVRRVEKARAAAGLPPDTE
jgi:hypothetical protein